MNSSRSLWQILKGSWLFFSLFSVLLLGPFFQGCSRKGEETEEEPPPVAKVELPPKQGTKEEPQKEVAAPTEKKPKTEAEPSPAQVTPPLATSEEALTAYVIPFILNVRSGPGTTRPVVGILLKGDKVTISDQAQVRKTTWYAIDAAGGYVDGWVSGRYLTFTPPPTTGPAKEIDYGPPETPTLVKGPFKYVGVEACKKCHVKTTGAFPQGAYPVWKNHLHSVALRSLSLPYTQVVAKRLRNVEDPAHDWRCLKCHVTAYGVDASQRAASYRDADGVGCEVCHGPGSEYAEVDHGPSNPNRYKLGFYKLTNLREREALCVSCHNPASPTYKSFNILAFSRDIQHWPDQGTTAYFKHAEETAREREKAAQAKAAAEQAGSALRAAEEQAEREAQQKRAETAEAERERQAAEERAQAAEAERTRRTAEEQAKAEQAEQETQQERSKAEQAERERQAAEERAKAAGAERERQAAEERAKAEQAERERQAVEERARAEREALAALERQKEAAKIEVERQEKAAAAVRVTSERATGIERHLAGLADILTLNPNGEKYQTARFTHSAHANKDYVVAIQCQVCHHTQEGDEKPEKCEQCHKIGGEAGEEVLKTRAVHTKDKPFPKEAGQDEVSCVGCHSSENVLLEAGQRSGKEAPTKCIACHQKKST